MLPSQYHRNIPDFTSPFQNLIKHILKNITRFKNIINVMIGKFEKYCDLKKIHKVSKIVNEDEKNTCNEYSVKLNNDLYAILEEQNKFDIFNKKPISIQIKDQSRVLLYEKMKELKLTYKNIIQIKTDSITFLNTNKRNYKKSLTNDIDGWKLENYNSINSSNFNDIPFTFKYIADFDNENILGNCYVVLGCTDPVACNYDISANTNDGSCNYSSSSYDTLVSNISISWNGMILTTSGDYSITLYNSVGCDSIVNLNFTFNTVSVINYNNTRQRTLIKITDILGRETHGTRNEFLFYIFNDGTVEKRIVIIE